jgi:hypothetical protein
LADFVFRLAFFALAPLAIVVVAELFPVRGALIDVGLALALFAAGETVRSRARERRWVRWLLKEALEFELHYRQQRPRPFAYYVFYPLLFPYWLTVREARREFLVFRSYTLMGLLLLVGSLVLQYFSLWRPELSLKDYLPAVLLALLIETVLVLSLLMPIATTVVWYHSSLRRRRLLVLLFVGLASTVASLGYVALRRDSIVSYATRERVRLRTAKAPRRAHRAMLRALQAAFGEDLLSGVEGDGKVEGAALEKARAALKTFYKPDEASAFDLWASPRRHARILVLYFEARRQKPPIWVAIERGKGELRARGALPRGAFQAMRRAAGAEDAELWTWPDEIDELDDFVADDAAIPAFRRASTRNRAVRAMPSSAPFPRVEGAAEPSSSATATQAP